MDNPFGKKQDIMTAINHARESIAVEGFAVNIHQPGLYPNTRTDSVHTVGLQQIGLPELVISGMHDSVTAVGLIGLCARLQRDQGEFLPGRLIKEVFKDGSPYGFMCVQVEDRFIDDLFPLNKVLFGPEIKTRAIQLAWPDVEGRFPWEPGAQNAESRKLGSKPSDGSSEAT